MEFVDISQCKIVNMNRFSTLKTKLDGDAYLDAPLSESAAYIQGLLQCSYRTPSVVYKVTVSLQEPNLDDFEVICDNVVAAIFRNNATAVERAPEDLKMVLNKLPSNRWVLKKQFAERVHCDTMTLLFAARHEWKNRNLNIFIQTSDGTFKYELIGADNA